MYNPFMSSFYLAFEAQRVIELRMMRLAWVAARGWLRRSR